MPPPAQLGAKLAVGGSADIFAWGERRVIKRFRRGTRQAAALQEAQCTQAARDAGAPAPQTFDVVEAEGEPGVIFERVEGGSLLEALLARAQDPVSVGRCLAQLHARVHALRSAQLPAQRARLQELLAHAPVDDDARRLVAITLERLPSGDSVCHGDFHPGNVLLGAAGPVLIDWYDAVQGCSTADVAQTSLLLLHARPPGTADADMLPQIDGLRRSVRDAYLSHYRALNDVDEQELADWELVMAAARLARNRVGAEHSALMTVVRRHLRRLQSSAAP